MTFGRITNLPLQLTLNETLGTLPLNLHARSHFRLGSKADVPAVRCEGKRDGRT